MRRVLFAGALLMATATPVEASAKTDVMEIAHRWTDASNSGSFNTDIAPCTAYLAATVELAYIKAGKLVDFPGTITITLVKVESGWRVSGVAWADQ